MSPGGATMESFFNRIVGRWSEKDRKKKSSLQESNRTGARLNGSAGGTDDPSDMTEPPPSEAKHNERCVDWSYDDDQGDDVTQRNNAVNEKDMRQTKRDEDSHTDRKPSFSLFGGRLGRRTKDDVTVGASRQPKRFFSQQNLRDEGSAFQGPVSSTPRFAPPKFLARLMSHQKYRSSQDLPSVHEGVRIQDQRRVSNSRPTTSFPGPVSTSRVKPFGKLPLVDVRLGPEGMEGDCCFVAEASSPDAGYPCSTEAARHDGDVLARAKRPSCSGWHEEGREEELDPSHVNRLRHSVVVGHDLSPSGRFLGEYRPRLNTHHEESAGTASVEDAHPRAAGFGSKNRWSLQAPEFIRGPISLDGQPLETRLVLQEASQEGVSAVPSTTPFVGVFTTTDIDDRARPSRETKVDHRIPSQVDRSREESVLRCYSPETDGDSLRSVVQRQMLPSASALPAHHFKSASYDSGVIGDHRRNPNIRRAGDTLPCRFSPNQIQALRQRSREFYGEYPLTQRKAVSNADICESLGDRRLQMLEADYRPAVVGRARAPDFNPPITETFRAGVGMSQQGSVGSPYDMEPPGHYRSLSMSQLPQRSGSHPNGFNPWPSDAIQKVSPNVEWLPGNWQQVAGHHERGGSLDSGEQDRIGAFDSTIIRPCVELPARRRSTVVEEQAYSDPEVVGNFKRRSYDPIERPLRYRFPNRHDSGQGNGRATGHGTGHGGGHVGDHASGHSGSIGSGHGGCHGTGHGSGHRSGQGGDRDGDVTSARRVQQQAVLNLFQKLTLAKQQRMYDAMNGSGISTSTGRSRESLSAAFGAGQQQPETKGWNDKTQVAMGWKNGIQVNRNLRPQTLTYADSYMSNDPEQTLRSPMSVGHQPYSVTHEKSDFNSYEDLSADLGSMDPLHIDEPSIDAPQFRLDCSKHPQIGDRLSPKVLIGYSNTNLTNQRSPSPVLTRSLFTDGHPLDTQLTHQGQNGTTQPHSSPPLTTPPPLPPRSPRLSNYSLDRDGGLALDAEDTYAHQLRQEARKLSLSSGSLRTVFSSKRDGICETNEVGRDFEDVFHPHPQPHEGRMQRQEREDEMKKDEADEVAVTVGWMTEADCNTRILKPFEFSEIDASLTSCNQFVGLRDGCAGNKKTKINKFDNNDSGCNKAWDLCDRKEIALIENGSAYSGSGRVQNESGRVQNESGRSKTMNHCIQSEPCETVLSHHDTSSSTSDVCSKRTGNASQAILPSTSDVPCSDQPTSGHDTELRTPDTTNGFPARLNGSIAHHNEPSSSLSSSEPVHSLKDFPDTDSSASAEDESFRGLASVLCRHLGSTDEELCSALRPPYVKASAEFVRRIFENRKILDLDLMDRLAQPCRTSRTSKEALKDSKIPHYSLQTLKDELLTLVDKRLHRLQERKHRLCDKQNETHLLEKKVTGIVRRKTKSKQFEKFCSYLEQLEKVVQLLLNLSVRLSNVEKDFCNISEEEDIEENLKKRLMDKRRQILERLREAMELKWSIDERSRLVSESLGDCLTPEEFNEYRVMVRSRCHVTLQSQELKEQTEVALMQRTVLFARCQPPQRQTPPPEMTQVEAEVT